uniref:Metallo-beta-lactamase domain-containing protein 1 n=1 Tax=Cairina moschata TaxID=8855 RepID=A0A8C3BJL8_CAIMO
MGGDPKYREFKGGTPKLVPGTPYSVRVLQEGYSHPEDEDGSFLADCSVTLIRGGPVTALVDTGGPWGCRRLLAQLEAAGTPPESVTHVLCTHGHSDHVGNLNLFPRAWVLVGFDLSRPWGGDKDDEGGRFVPLDLARGVPYAPHPGYVEVLPTPGHVRAHVSVAVMGTALGTVVAAGDLFEREGDEGVWGALSEDPPEQERSRRKVLEVADVVVPGHGAPFRVFREGA